MIVEYQQSDGSALVFGYMMADGPLTSATGQILRAWHHKCFHIARKREARGDAVTGRVLAGGPTAYNIGTMVMSRDELCALGIDPLDAAFIGTEHISSRLGRLRAVAQRVGKGVGDLTVLEAFWADEASGPYEHGHHLKLEMYQLRAHLQYAHGSPATTFAGNAQTLHDQLHAKAHLEAILAIRGDDPGHHPGRAPNDWRDQVIADIPPASERLL